MARTSRRPKNRLMKEIDQGIQEYQACARELSCRRKYGRLIDILTGERQADGIFFRPVRVETTADRVAPDPLRVIRPILWS